MHLRDKKQIIIRFDLNQTSITLIRQVPTFYKFFGLPTMKIFLW